MFSKHTSLSQKKQTLMRDASDGKTQPLLPKLVWKGLELI